MFLDVFSCLHWVVQQSQTSWLISATLYQLQTACSGSPRNVVKLTKTKVGSHTWISFLLHYITVPVTYLIWLPGNFRMLTECNWYAQIPGRNPNECQEVVPIDIPHALLVWWWSHWHTSTGHCSSDIKRVRLPKATTGRDVHESIHIASSCTYCIVMFKARYTSLSLH